MGDKLCYIDKNGEVVIELAGIPAAREFSEGFAPIAFGGGFEFDSDDEGNIARNLVGEKWGYIDRSGQLVIEAKFDGAF